MLDRSKLYRNHFAIDPEKAKAAVEAYRSGKSSTQVSKDLGIADRTVLDYARRAGCPIRPVRRYEKLTPEQREGIERGYAQGDTLEVLAQRYEVCVLTVSKHLKSRGLSIGVAGSNKRRSLPKEDRCVNRVYGTYQRSARKRGISFKLTREEVASLVFGPCAYCGRVRVNSGRRDLTDSSYNGIDRLDNQRGYEDGNVVPCCHDCNRAKSDKTLDEFRAWVGLVYNTLGSQAKS